MKATIQMTIRVEPALYERISQIARAKQISINSAAIDALERYSKRNNSLLSVGDSAHDEKNIEPSA